MKTYKIACCPLLADELKKPEGLISIIDVVPFTRVPNPPTCYFVSDGGHGGMLKLRFCPFCGQRITIKESPVS